MTTRFQKYMLFIFLSLLLGMREASAGDPAKSTINIGDPAPAFKLKDLDGKEQDLNAFKGKIVVLEWTNPNCPFVIRHYEKGWMQALQKKYTEKGIVWLTINSTNPDHRDFLEAEVLKEKYAAWKAAFTAQLMDADGTVGKLYEAKTTPHIFILDTGLMLAYQGAVDDDPRGNKETKIVHAADALEALLAGLPIQLTTSRPYGCSIKYAN